jgi:hypothetical protein
VSDLSGEIVRDLRGLSDKGVINIFFYVELIIGTINKKVKRSDKN